MERPKATMLSVFLLAMSVLLLEICLTHIFSVLSWHHFAYLIISLALLGFGAAGSYLTVAKRFADETIKPERLAWFAWMFALTAVGGIVLVTKIHFYPVDIALRNDYSNALSLVIMYILVGIPFFFAGVCLGRLVALAGARINKVYFADLVGAGIDRVPRLVRLLNQVRFEALVGLLAVPGTAPGRVERFHDPDKLVERIHRIPLHDRGDGGNVRKLPGKVNAGNEGEKQVADAQSG